MAHVVGAVLFLVANLLIGSCGCYFSSVFSFSLLRFFLLCFPLLVPPTSSETIALCVEVVNFCSALHDPILFLPTSSGIVILCGSVDHFCSALDVQFFSLPTTSVVIDFSYVLDIPLVLSLIIQRSSLFVERLLFFLSFSCYFNSCNSLWIGCCFLFWNGPP